VSEIRLSRPQVEPKDRRERQQDVAGDRDRCDPLCTADHYEHGGSQHTDYRGHLHSSDAVAHWRLPASATDSMMSSAYQLKIDLVGESASSSRPWESLKRVMQARG
jgi:hypothetical protein